MEYADTCIKCQERHLKVINKPSWEVECTGIPKQLWENNYYPLEEMIGADAYFDLSEEELITLHYKYNKMLWAKDAINWSTYNEKRDFDQYYQKELLLCTAKRKVGRLGRRMGKCLSKNSLILTKEKGLIKVKDLKPGMSLMTFDEKIKDFKFTDNWQKWKNGIKPIFKLKTRLGNIDYVTDNHPYYKFTEKGLEWIEVKDLKPGDKIVAAKSYKKLYNFEDELEYNEQMILEDLKYFNKNNKVPDELWSRNNQNVVKFLSAVFDNGGCISKHEFSYQSFSYDKINALKHLFKRFGINFRLEKKGTNETYFKIIIQNFEQMFLFYANIRLNKKQPLLEEILKLKKGNDTPWLNVMPKEINSIIKEECRQQEYTTTGLSKKLKTTLQKKYAPSIHKINKINKVLKNQFMDFVANGNIIFDEIISINSNGEEMTYDINVPGTNNFITNDLLTHNSEVLSVDSLHFACNNPGKTVMILTPFQNTADELYERMCGMLEGEFSIYKTKFKKKAKPNTIVIFVEGKKSIIKLFTTGTKSGSEGASTRGQKADRIYFDETAYFTNKDIETVYALALESEDVEIIAFSTPTALKTLYRNWCNNEPHWKDFHFPSTILPNWDKVKKEMEGTYDEQGFAQEILAEFFESSGKVFLTEAINSSLRTYDYSEKINDIINPEQWISVIGELDAVLYS